MGHILKMGIEKMIKEEPFLTMRTRSINGWYMASCPEFEVSAWGYSEEEVIEEVHEMIKANSYVLLKSGPGKKPRPKYLLEYAKIIKEKEDISDLFRRPKVK